MNVLIRQMGIMSDLGMGEGREFVDYNENTAFPAGGVMYNWAAAGDLKDYSGTAEQWAAIQSAQTEMATNNTVIIATYEAAKDATVRLKLDADGNVYFVAPDGTVTTITESGAESFDYKQTFLNALNKA